MSALLQAESLTVSHGPVRALHDVSLAVEAGEIVTLVGPNGSGKSSLVKALIGALRPSEGRITRAPGLRIGYVPQKLAIDATMPLSVRRFLSLPVPATVGEIDTALDRVGLEGHADRELRTLSGGQFQRAMLARAILHTPHLLILDEPTQGLDQPGIASFYRLIESLRTTLGCAILLVSHDLHVVMSASDRVICLNGHICCEGAPHVVSSAPAYRALFGLGTGGALALYPHAHDHTHDGAQDSTHVCDAGGAHVA